MDGPRQEATAQLNLNLAFLEVVSLLCLSLHMPVDPDLGLIS